MRYDMHEVVIERPRTGGAYSYRNVRPRGTIEQLEHLPSKQGMRKPYGYNLKEFNDNLEPLRRFLISRVGKPWDKVYSEIRERLNPNSTVQIHILGHVFQFVNRNTCFYDDGKIFCDPQYGRWHRYLSPGELYVHPKSGILCRIPEARSPYKYRAKVNPDTKKIGDREARKINGIWYWWSERKVISSGGQNVDVTVDKKQLNSQELRRYELVNSP